MMSSKEKNLSCLNTGLFFQRYFILCSIVLTWLKAAIPWCLRVAMEAEQEICLAFGVKLLDNNGETVSLRAMSETRSVAFHTLGCKLNTQKLQPSRDCCRMKVLRKKNLMRSLMCMSLILVLSQIMRIKNAGNW